MRTINRLSPEIALNGGRSVTRQYATISKRTIYFTAAIAKICEMNVGLYVHFLNDGKEWNFYINDDPDGFKLTPVIAKGGFQVTSSGLNKMILTSMGFSLGHAKRVAINKTLNIHDKCPVYAISTVGVSTVVR